MSASEQGLPEKSVLIKKGMFTVPANAWEKPALIGSRCKLCGHVVFPARSVCPGCVRDECMEECLIGRRGEIYSYSVSYVAPPGFASPYIQAFVKLDEGPLIFTLLDGGEETGRRLEIGQEVELIIGTVKRNAAGQEVIAWKYRLPGGK